MKEVLMSIQPYWVFLIIARKMGWNIGKEKTTEVRKNFPKDENWNKVVKMYCSKNKKSFSLIPKEYQPLMKPFLGKVIGEFICNSIKEYESEFVDNDCLESIASIDRCEDDVTGFYEWKSDELIAYRKTNFFKGCCIEYEDLKKYLGIGFNTFYGWHISDLVIYDKPKELSEFHKVGYNSMLFMDFLTENGSQSRYWKITRPPQSWCYVEELSR